jgi:hypothetical protein
MLKRLFRRFFPRKLHPLLDGPVRQVPNDEAYSRAYHDVIEREDAAADDFIRARYAEGQRW